MLSRFLSSSSTRLLLTRSLTLVFTSSSPISRPSPLSPLPPSHLPRPSIASFSSKRSKGGDDGKWKLTPQNDDSDGSLFEVPDEEVRSGSIPADGAEWEAEAVAEEKKGVIFEEIDRELKTEDKRHLNEFETAEGFKPWGFGEDKGEEKGDVFGILDEEISEDFDASHEVEDNNKKAEEMAILKLQEKQLRAVVKGPDRSFGDLITESGITDEMLDSLLLLKDVRGVEGLPSYREIEDMFIKGTDDTSGFEEEKKKQQAIEKARVKKVDEKGRAYGTGKRKCSVARVFIQPGDGKFTVNDKQFDSYFPCLSDRANLLSPFHVTETVGQWDIYCTVKGGGISGQVGAIRLGISRALQNFEPGFRQYLRPAGFLTRDARIVERKKPGKAKARKSFQWSKR